MITFGVEIDKHELVDKFITDTNKRLQSANLIRNPFTGSVYLINNIIVFDLHNIFPNLTVVGLLLLVAPLFFTHSLLTLWSLPGAIIILVYGFFFTRAWIFIALCIALKKIGYKGKIKLISDSETIRRILQWAKPSA